MTIMNADEWLFYGIEKGYCGPPVCATHDGLPTNIEEEEEFDEGHDPCVFVIRPYADDNDKQSVETNHSPSIWRGKNMGIK